jgi:hypothetical protein
VKGRRRPELAGRRARWSRRRTPPRVRNTDRPATAATVAAAAVGTARSAQPAAGRIRSRAGSGARMACRHCSAHFAQDRRYFTGGDWPMPRPRTTSRHHRCRTLEEMLGGASSAVRSGPGAGRLDHRR